MRDKTLLIPVYGMLKGIAAHAEVGRLHKIACEVHRKNPTPENYRKTWELFEKSWPAMNNALIGLWVTVGELVVLVILVALIANGLSK